MFLFENDIFTWLRIVVNNNLLLILPCPIFVSMPANIHIARYAEKKEKNKKVSGRDLEIWVITGADARQSRRQHRSDKRTRILYKTKSQRVPVVPVSREPFNPTVSSIFLVPENQNSSFVFLIHKNHLQLPNKSQSCANDPSKPSLDYITDSNVCYTVHMK